MRLCSQINLMYFGTCKLNQHPLGIYELFLLYTNIRIRRFFSFKWYMVILSIINVYEDLTFYITFHIPKFTFFLDVFKEFVLLLYVNINASLL